MINIKKLLGKGPKMPIIIASVVIVVGFLTWLTIRVLTMDARLEQEVSLKLPEFNSLENLRAVTSESYAVAVDGAVATEANADTARPTASTAKMILGLAIMRQKPFELGTPGETITIDEEMYNRYIYYVQNGGSYTAVQTGEEISEYDALISVFLVSSNNMADTLAIWAFGSLENYRTYASQMLSELGLTQTTIGSDASGFDPATTSTASELARIGYLVMQNPVLAEIVNTKSHNVPVAGTLNNTNALLGQSGIVGVKTGWIGDASGYCLITSYLMGEHVVDTALLGAATREESFNTSLDLVNKMQSLVTETEVARAGAIVGYYESWWTGKVPIRAQENLSVIGWNGAEQRMGLEMNGSNGAFKVKIGNYDYSLPVKADDYDPEPSLWDKIRHAFGWSNDNDSNTDDDAEDLGSNTETGSDSQDGSESDPEPEQSQAPTTEFAPVTNVPSDNCTVKYGYLMLINPNFTVATDFIDARRSELVSISSLYGIVEGNPYNGDNLLDAEAASHLNDMVKAYTADYPGHSFETRSCYRARGTTCGRLCAATGTSDHHTGLTCDLVDPVYGDSLDTSTYDNHPDWQWLYANSYKYGFIDRFPEEWAGGSMAEPLNVDENGSTGLFETWHYRYVGVDAATEIATGKYNNGQYDSLEHYLKARGLVTDLKAGRCN